MIWCESNYGSVFIFPSHLQVFNLRQYAYLCWFTNESHNILLGPNLQILNRYNISSSQKCHLYKALSNSDGPLSLFLSYLKTIASSHPSLASPPGGSTVRLIAVAWLGSNMGTNPLKFLDASVPNTSSSSRFIRANLGTKTWNSP